MTRAERRTTEQDTLRIIFRRRLRLCDHVTGARFRPAGVALAHEPRACRRPPSSLAESDRLRLELRGDRAHVAESPRTLSFRPSNRSHHDLLESSALGSNGVDTVRDNDAGIVSDALRIDVSLRSRPYGMRFVLQPHAGASRQIPSLRGRNRRSDDRRDRRRLSDWVAGLRRRHLDRSGGAARELRALLADRHLLLRAARCRFR
jgi:hypothetical protein